MDPRDDALHDLLRRGVEAAVVDHGDRMAGVEQGAITGLVFGSIFAATNLLTFSGTLLATGIFFLMRSVLGLSNQTIFLIVGIALIPFVIVLIRATAFDTTRAITSLLRYTRSPMRLIGSSAMSARRFSTPIRSMQIR